MSNYIKTTNFTAKDNLPSGNAAKKIVGSEFDTEFNNISTAIATKADTTTVNIVTTTANAALPKTGGAMTGAITTNSTFDGVDVATRNGVLTTTTNTANAALPKAGGAMTGAITTNSTFDGRDIATDGTKLDGIEASATADQTPAEIRAAVEAATDSNVFTDADHTKLNAIEASADVTDTANVTAAGALMDSEVTNLAQVKAFDSTDYATAAQGTLATNALPKAGGTLTGALNVDVVANPTITLKNTDTSIAADQVIGTVEFRGADDSGNVLAGHIQQVSAATWGIGSYDSDMVFSTKTGGTGGSFTEKLRVNRFGVAITGATTVTTASANHSTALTFKNGTLTSGKINTHFTNTDGYFSIGNKAAGLRFIDFQTSRQIAPYNVDANVNSDNLIDLGSTVARFDDIYATNATIQTSDRNEKQDIEELTDAETRVAVACKGLLRKFRWKSAVEDKGTAARTHFGIIAQDLQAAFEAEGLDAGNYAMFISTTWTNEDGEEQTRMGVRYSELLAFIIGGI